MLGLSAVEHTHVGWGDVVDDDMAVLPTMPARLAPDSIGLASIYIQ
jgi:hypothetical protein